MKKIILLTALILSSQSFASPSNNNFNRYFVESSFKMEFLSQLQKKVANVLGDPGWDEVASAFDYSGNYDFFKRVKEAVDDETDKQMAEGFDTCREQMWYFFYGKVEKEANKFAENILKDIDFSAVNFFYPLSSYITYLKWMVEETIKSEKFQSLISIHSLNLRQLREEQIKELTENYEKISAENSNIAEYQVPSVRSF